MPKTEPAAYATERAKLQTQPIYFARFRHVKKSGDGTDYPFSVDFSTDLVTGPTVTKLPYMQKPTGSLQTIDHENGRSSIGTFTLRFADITAEILRYFAPSALTLKTAMTAASPANGGAVDVNEDISGLPQKGTTEITTGGVIERVRYTAKNLTTRQVTGITRGVDDTVAASHAVNDPIANGEQIRPGQRVQLFAGYAPLAEADYLAFAKMELLGRTSPDGVALFEVRAADIQRTMRKTVFLGRTTNSPVKPAGNPVDIALAVITSTGNSSIGAGTISTTAGSAIVTGSGTAFLAFLTVGAAVLAGNGEIFRVASIQSDTQFTAVQAAIRTFSAQIYAKGGTNGKFDFFGAADALGVPQALVDLAGLESLRDTEFPSDQYDFSLTEPAEGKTFLEEQIWKTLNVYPVIKQDGKYSARRFKETGAASATLDEASIISWGWAMGDQGVINTVQFAYDWDLPATRGIFSARQFYTHQGSIDKFGKRPTFLMESKGIKTALGGQAILDNRALEIIRRFAEPTLILSVDVFYRHHVLEAGDFVSVTHSLIPNPQAGTRGLSGALFQIIQMEPRFEAGRMRLQLMNVGALPAAPVAPVAGGATGQQIPLRDDQAPATPTGVTLATGTAVAPDGTVQTFLEVSWTANTEADLAEYVVQFRRAGDVNWSSRFVRKESTALREFGVVGNVAYDVRMLAKDLSSNASAFTALATITTAKDPTAPGLPTGIAASGGFQLVLVTWTNPTDADFDRVEIWRNTVNNSATAAKIGEARGVGFADTQLANATTFFYWLKARDTSGNVTGFTVAVSATTLRIATDDVATNAVDTSKLAALIQRYLGSPPDNLLVNPGGEEGTVGAQAPGWTLLVNNNLVVATDFAKIGERSLKIDNPVAVDSANYQVISLVAGALYELSGWIKTTALPIADPGLGALLNIDIVAGITGFTIIEKIGDDFTAAQPDVGLFATGVARDWTQVRARFIPLGADGTVRVYCQLGFGAQSGTAWFDGIVLRRLYLIATDDLLANSITAGKILAGAVVAGKIAANSITVAGNELSDLVVLTAKIAANAVTNSGFQGASGPNTVGTTETLLNTVSMSGLINDFYLVLGKAWVDQASQGLAAALRVYMDQGAGDVLQDTTFSFVDLNTPGTGLMVMALVSITSSVNPVFRLKGQTTAGTVVFHDMKLSVIRIQR